MVQSHDFEEHLDTYCLKGLNLGHWLRAPEIFEAVSSRESWVLVWATLDITRVIFPCGVELNGVHST